MKPTDLLELNDDLQRESERLARLVSSVELLLPRLGEGGELVEAAALRLHSFYTAVERCLLLISRVVNGGTPSKGEGWHRRLLERMATATEQRPAVLKEATQVGLQEYLRFRHLVRNLYADELRPEPIALLLRQLPPLWHLIQEDLVEFRHWLRSTASSHNL